MLLGSQSVKLLMLILKVLILIVLEDALGAFADSFIGFKAVEVLILIVLEDALGDRIAEIPYIRSAVLILIVLEDALGVLFY